jgi:epoxyqueuosine reductase
VTVSPAIPALEDRLKQQARALGFELVGIAPATEADHFEQFLDWLAQDYAGDMDYLHRHAAAHRHPAAILPEVRSVIMVGMNYNPGVRSQESGVRSQESGVRSQESGDRARSVSEGPHTARTVGKIARYARGADYHDVLRARLKQLLAWLQTEVPGCAGRAVVDTAPLLERDFARRAGLGWFGKNTMLLNKRLGSYFFLGALLVNLPLRADAPHDTAHCGTCTACLDACPTQAFPAPGQLDARRCISYLTIELRGPVPDELRPPMGDWLFGCDVCQEVCPWNRKAPAGTEPAFAPWPELEAIDLLELFTFSEEEFRRRFRGTALTRPKRAGLLRNAALVLGNRGDPAALPALERAAADRDPVVRDAARWAVERIRQRVHASAIAVE